MKKYRPFLALLLGVSLFMAAVPAYATGEYNDTENSTPADSDEYIKDGDMINGTIPAPPEISAAAAVMIDASTGSVLYEKNMNKKMYPASMTKVITAIVALNHASLTDKVTFSDTAVNSLAWDDMSIGISVGETLTLKDALFGLLLPSANECANGIAEFIGGSNAGFADMMNEWTASVGAVNSHFVTPSGLFDEAHYTTAYDMAIIARAAIQNSSFLEFESHTDYVVTATNSVGDTREIEIDFSHEMADEEGFVAGKTGFEDEAGYNLMTVMERKGTTLIVVVMDDDDRYPDTLSLFEYGFSNFETSTVSKTIPSLFASQAGDGFYSIFNSDYYPVSIDADSPLITIKGMDISSITIETSYNVESSLIPTEGALGYVTFSYGSFILGYSPIIKSTASASTTPDETPGVQHEEPVTNTNTGNDLISMIRGLPTMLKVFCIILLIVLVLLLISVIGYLAMVLRVQLLNSRKKKRNRERQARRRQQERRERLDSRRVLEDDGSDELDF